MIHCFPDKGDCVAVCGNFGIINSPRNTAFGPLRRIVVPSSSIYLTIASILKRHQRHRKKHKTNTFFFSTLLTNTDIYTVCVNRKKAYTFTSL